MKQTVIDNSKALKKWVFPLVFGSFALSFWTGMGSISENRNVDERLQSKADSALVFCRKEKMNTDFCILIDMKIHSGKNRLFVWDFNKNEILLSGLCCHGEGGESTGKQPVFSNQAGSNCTSLGKYKLEQGRIVIGASTYITKCTDWNPRIITHSEG